MRFDWLMTESRCYYKITYLEASVALPLDLKIAQVNNQYVDPKAIWGNEHVQGKNESHVYIQIAAGLAHLCINR